MPGFINTINKVIEGGPFQAEWESLRSFSVPDWYIDGKFGIFIHWGVYCVPAFGSEWYPRQMYLPGSVEYQHHIETYGPQTKFGYKDFIPQFKAEAFDPAGWANLFKKAGARFVVPVAEHHDGFAMYDCSYSRWCAAKMGPKRDILGDLAAAVRQAGLVFGLSSHRAEHWWFFNGGMTFPSDVKSRRFRGLYGPAALGKSTDMGGLDAEPYPDEKYLKDWLYRTCELVDKYQPQLVWFDWWVNHTAFKSVFPRFAAYYYNRGLQWDKGVAINYKLGVYPHDAAVFDMERGMQKEIYPFFWQNDTAISKNSWGYVKNQDYKTAADLVGDLVDLASKNGALLLNIGPRPDGTIPEAEQKILLDIGEWLAVNGEAIYGTRPWKVYGEGPTQVVEGQFTDTKRTGFTGEDIRFTAKGTDLYAVILAWPGSQAEIKSLGTAAGLWEGGISRVSLLGHPGALEFSCSEGSLLVKMPEHQPCRHAFVLKITS